LSYFCTEDIKEISSMDALINSSLASLTFKVIYLLVSGLSKSAEQSTTPKRSLKVSKTLS
jgi:hypothetical protein